MKVSTFIKKRIQQRYFLWFCKIFKSPLLIELFKSIPGWLLHVLTCESWEILQNNLFLEHIRDTAYFMYKLQDFSQQ